LNPEENLAAFKIQTHWRVFVLKRNLKSRNEAADNRIVIYLSTDSVDVDVGQKARKIDDQCSSMGYKTSIVDLVEKVHQAKSTDRRKEISLLNYRLPLVFIGDNCIGEISDWDRLIESTLIKEVVEEGGLCLLKTSSVSACYVEPNASL
jgi:hypothetical protein